MIAAVLPEWLNQLARRALFLPEQLSAYARSVDSLHYLEMTAMTGVTMGIAVVAVAFAWRFRRSRHPRSEDVHPPLAVDLSVYGVLLAFFVLLWVIGYRQYLSLGDPPPRAMEIYVTGKQWMWKFSYPEGANSANVLVVPARQPVRLLLTSRDVIHSFFVPALRIKRDAVPGLYTDIWFQADRPGRFPILCTEFCGTGHSRMLGTLVVLESGDWLAWRRDQSPPADAAEGTKLAELGMEVAVRNGCLGCHTASGAEWIAPTWRGAYGARVRLQGGETVTVDEAYLTRSMMDPTAQVVDGFAPIMPSYQGQLDAAEVGALVEYIKSLAGTPGERPEPRSHER